MSVPLLEGRTIYALLGDWPKVVLIIFMLLLIGKALRPAAVTAPKPAAKRPNKSRAQSKSSKGTKRKSPSPSKKEKLKPKKL